MEILSFFAGIAFFFTKSYYPLLGLSLAFLFKTRGNVHLLIWFFAAIFWAFLHEYACKDQGMPEGKLIHKAALKGRVASIPAVTPFKTQFHFSIETLNGHPVKAVVMMACYQHCPLFKLNELWEVEAKLKRPQNLGNPGHFDYKGGLDARHIHWTAYIKGKRRGIDEPQNTDHFAGHFTDYFTGNFTGRFSLIILRFRESISEKLGQLIPDPNTRAIVEALTLGLTGHMDKSLWDLFRRTGTTHLMVISGAHISLVAGIAYWLFKKMWCLIPRLCLYLPAQISAGAFAVLIIFGYCLIAGFAPPAQRAFLACCFVMLCHFFGRRFTAWQCWRYALLLIVIWEPHVVLFPGFYLSFLAVATLISSSQRIRYRGIKKAVCLQFACLFGLMPMTLYWFSYAALTGVVANMIAIPLVGYLLVPLSLILVFVSIFFNQPAWMLPVDSLAKLLLGYLHWLDQFSYLNLSLSLTDACFLFALMLAFMLFFFIPTRIFSPVAIVLLLTIFFPNYSHIKPSEAQIDVLDVGQGLSVVISTVNHTLVYDTGMKFFQGSDMAQMAIIPYLEKKQVKKIDMVIISHPDLDHRGGLASLEAKYPITTFVVNEVSFYHRGHNCHKYPAWTWDDINFRFFPIREKFQSTNNFSCVLQVSNRTGRILLTGDIEALAEAYLVNNYREQLKSEILVIPHHGSKTSSTKAFIQEVSPLFAIISAGFDNRYHFPHQKTLETLASVQAKVQNTMNCGMVTVKLSKDKPITAPTCYWDSKNNSNSN